eukprot:CAMPEP_0176304396 /NCGR_PEP_ID=MMETSP0121_2-20121125/62407_1 /TAXON_ID=160619 /ORGANISM="Kryptoperidinium foliaceum, Strain CCMP 1326" /LENGTH=290 /DNA_ID=CAMNT_0017645997 /DNA_START=298 /DNA_END=1168 /DNA_ORIENTATION=+
MPLPDRSKAFCAARRVKESLATRCSWAGCEASSFWCLMNSSQTGASSNSSTAIMHVALYALQALDIVPASTLNGHSISVYLLYNCSSLVLKLLHHHSDHHSVTVVQVTARSSSSRGPEVEMYVSKRPTTSSHFAKASICLWPFFAAPRKTVDNEGSSLEGRRGAGRPLRPRGSRDSLSRSRHKGGRRADRAPAAAAAAAATSGAPPAGPIAARAPLAAAAPPAGTGAPAETTGAHAAARRSPTPTAAAHAAPGAAASGAAPGRAPARAATREAAPGATAPRAGGGRARCS